MTRTHERAHTRARARAHTHTQGDPEELLEEISSLDSKVQHIGTEIEAHIPKSIYIHTHCMYVYIHIEYMYIYIKYMYFFC